MMMNLPVGRQMINLYLLKKAPLSSHSEEAFSIYGNNLLYLIVIYNMHTVFTND